MIDTVALRKSIIDLATSGQLSSICDGDDSIGEILDQLPAASAKRKNLLAQEYEFDELFSIPDRWKWMRLGEIASYGDTPTKVIAVDVTDDTWILELEDIEAGGKLLAKKRVDSRKSIGEKTVFKKGQVLYSKLRPYLKKVLVADENGISTPELISFDVYADINAHYIKYCLTNSYVDRVINKRSYGIKMPRVDTGFMVNLPIPIPPKQEQERIVKVVESIMEEIDCIDEAQKKYTHDAEVLTAKLIDAGIQGKLTEQRPEDGTAEDLYREIQAEKTKLIQEGKIKKEKALQEITENEIPFEIPQNWKWVRLGDISESIQYGYNAPAKDKGRIKMVRISDIQYNKVLWDSVPYCDIGEENIRTYILHENDILFARSGGTVGKSYLVSEMPEEAIYAGYLIRTSYSKRLCAKYMKYFMESRLYWKQLQNGTIATAQPNCNGQTLSKMMLPLPPLEEQVRIVGKLDELLINF